MADSPVASPAQPVPYSKGLSRLALITALAVFPLIFVGASVTSKEVGMAYLEGFTSDGYLIQNPPGWWDSDDTRWEHGHRLLGRLVGILSIILAIWCWRRGGGLRWLGGANLLAICIQGTLGAFRVYEVSTLFAMIHGIFGQLCFCLTCTVALITSKAWYRSSVRAVRAADFLKKLCIAGVLAVFVQLTLGAGFRHFSGQAMLLAHIFWAVVVTFMIGWLAMWLMGIDRHRHILRTLGRVLAVLMTVQLLLGGATFVVTVIGGNWSDFVVWVVPSLHTAVGALMLVCTVLITISGYQFLRLAPQRLGARAEVAATP